MLDPFNLNYIVSSQCLEDELEVCKQLMASASGESAASDRILEQVKMYSISVKITALQNQVDNGELTIPEYKAMVKERLARDGALARYLIKEKDLRGARRVKRRMELMAQEIKELDQMEADGEAGAESEA